MSKNSRVFLLGSGWGAVAACKGLQAASFQVFLLETDPDLEVLGATVSPNSMAELQEELLVFAGYKKIIPEHILRRNTCINVHYSLLPKYRGFHSTVWAILNDEPELGLTVHLMNEYIDDGPVLAQYRVRNDYRSTSVFYMMCFNDYISNHLGRIVKDYLDGTIIPVPQKKTDASWVGKRNMEDCRIDFSRPIKYLQAFFRALVPPYPLPFFEVGNKRLLVKEVDFFFSPVITHIGRILNIDNEGVWIKVQDGYLILKEITDSDNNAVDFDYFKIGQFLSK